MFAPPPTPTICTPGVAAQNQDSCGNSWKRKTGRGICAVITAEEIIPNDDQSATTMVLLN